MRRPDHKRATQYRQGLRRARRRATSVPRADATPCESRTLTLIRAALLILLSFAPGFALAAGWALGGMDAVAYRSAGDAIPGESEISTRWAGQEWHFATEENRAAFEANPRAFAPGFKGLCPVALAEGRAVEGNPRYFAVAGDRLYLFESEGARRAFLKDPQNGLKRAKAAFGKLAQ